MNDNEDELTESELIEITNSLRDYQNGKFKHGKIDDLLKDLNDSKVEKLLTDTDKSSIDFNKGFKVVLYTELFIIYLGLYIIFVPYINQQFTQVISTILILLLSIFLIFMFIDLFMFIEYNLRGD